MLEYEYEVEHGVDFHAYAGIGNYQLVKYPIIQ